jgi:hypothetical protein
VSYEEEDTCVRQYESAAIELWLHVHVHLNVDVHLCLQRFT